MCLGGHQPEPEHHLNPGTCWIQDASQIQDTNHTQDTNWTQDTIWIQQSQVLLDQ